MKGDIELPSNWCKAVPYFPWKYTQITIQSIENREHRTRERREIHITSDQMVSSQKPDSSSSNICCSNTRSRTINNKNEPYHQNPLSSYTLTTTYASLASYILLMSFKSSSLIFQFSRRCGLGNEVGMFVAENIREAKLAVVFSYYLDK